MQSFFLWKVCRTSYEAMEEVTENNTVLNVHYTIKKLVYWSHSMNFKRKWKKKIVKNIYFSDKIELMYRLINERKCNESN